MAKKTKTKTQEPTTLHPPGGGGGSTTTTPAPSDGASGPYQEAEVSDNSLIAYVAAWGVVLLLMMLLNRTRWGHAIIYYGLLLALFVLLVANYQAVTALLAPASGPQGGSGPETQNGIPPDPTTKPATKQKQTDTQTTASFATFSQPVPQVRAPGFLTASGGYTGGGQYG